jgi:hypothetical protein
MREYWHIVPINDGCTVLCKDFNNGFYIGRKEDSLKNEDVLIFVSEQEAQEYINEWFEPGYYRPEEFWILKGK